MYTYLPVYLATDLSKSCFPWRPLLGQDDRHVVDNIAVKYLQK